MNITTPTPAPSGNGSHSLAVRALAAFLAAVCFAVLFASASARPADASTTMRSMETRLIELHNAARAAHGLPALREHPTMTVESRKWSQHMSNTGVLEHQSAANGYTSYAYTTCAVADPQWRGCAENVGVGAAADGIHAAFMASPGHKANVLSSTANRIGVGYWKGTDGRLWVTVRFLAGTTASTPAPPAHPQDPTVSTGALLSAGQSDVLRLYRAFFNREPDVAGARYWVSTYDRGTSLATIAESFAMSAEFAANYQGTSNRAYVTKVYGNVLGRTPDLAGLNYWTSTLDQRKLSRAGVVQWITANDEFKNRHPYSHMV